MLIIILRLTDEAYGVFFEVLEAQARSIARTLLVRFDIIISH